MRQVNPNNVAVNHSNFVGYYDWHINAIQHTNDISNQQPHHHHNADLKRYHQRYVECDHHNHL